MDRYVSIFHFWIQKLEWNSYPVEHPPPLSCCSEPWQGHREGESEQPSLWVSLESWLPLGGDWGQWCLPLCYPGRRRTPVGSRGGLVRDHWSQQGMCPESIIREIWLNIITQLLQNNFLVAHRAFTLSSFQQENSHWYEYLKHCSNLSAEVFKEGVVQRFDNRGHLITEYDGALWRRFTALKNILKHWFSLTKKILFQWRLGQIGIKKKTVLCWISNQEYSLGKALVIQWSHKYFTLQQTFLFLVGDRPAEVELCCEATVLFMSKAALLSANWRITITAPITPMWR